MNKYLKKKTEILGNSGRLISDIVLNKVTVFGSIPAHNTGTNTEEKKN